MTSSALFRRFVLTALLVCGCGDGEGNGDSDTDVDSDTDTDTDGTGLSFGEPCAADDECADGACVEDACSRECDEYEDCPEEGYRCAGAGDRTACVPSEFDEGIGQNCTFDPCPGGLTCHSRGEDDPAAYCSEPCESERDCPEGFICAGSITSPEPHCRLPDFCDSCLIDDDCGIGGRCLVDDGGERYCSVVCTLGLATCPAGGVCMEQEGGRPACAPVAGLCGPTGDLCSSCESDEDCSAGGRCLHDRFSGGVFCGSPCDDASDCPAEHYCNANAELVAGGPAGSQCYPRTGDCGDPSRGGLMCYPCDSIGDCYNGFCIRVGIINVCGEDCAEGGKDVCPPFSECSEIFSGGRVIGMNCLPENDNPCYLWQQCLGDLGEGICEEGSECVMGDCSG